MGCNCGKRKISANTKKVQKVPTNQNRAGNKPLSSNGGKRIIRRAFY